jgi:hypothetical protein
MRVKYLGPAGTFTVGDKVHKPGDTFDLSEGQLLRHAAFPAGNGVHHFALAEDDVDKLSEQRAQYAAESQMSETDRLIMKAMQEQNQAEEKSQSRTQPPQKPKTEDKP